MSVLVAVSPLQGEPYFDALSRIPGLTVWREDEDPPPEQVEAILAWRMKDGFVGCFPNLRMGTSHTEYWLREPRICRTRGCPERYVFRPVCRTCHQRTERM